jgi:hypothetical protein
LPQKLNIKIPAYLTLLKKVAHKTKNAVNEMKMSEMTVNDRNNQEISPDDKNG